MHQQPARHAGRKQLPSNVRSTNNGSRTLEAHHRRAVIAIRTARLAASIRLSICPAYDRSPNGFSSSTRRETADGYRARSSLQRMR